MQEMSEPRVARAAIANLLIVGPSDDASCMFAGWGRVCRGVAHCPGASVIPVLVRSASCCSVVRVGRGGRSGCVATAAAAVAMAPDGAARERSAMPDGTFGRRFLAATLAAALAGPALGGGAVKAPLLPGIVSVPAGVLDVGETCGFLGP